MFLMTLRSRFPKKPFDSYKMFMLFVSSLP